MDRAIQWVNTTKTHWAVQQLRLFSPVTTGAWIIEVSAMVILLSNCLFFFYTSVRGSSWSAKNKLKLQTKKIRLERMMFMISLGNRPRPGLVAWPLVHSKAMLSCLASEWKWGWGWSCFDGNLSAFFILMMLSSCQLVVRFLRFFIFSFISCLCSQVTLKTGRQVSINFISEVILIM